MRYSQGTCGTTPPILASMTMKQEKAAKRSELIHLWWNNKPAKKDFFFFESHNIPDGTM